MEIQEKEVNEAPSRRGRKKIADKSTWKREIAKSNRHKPKGPPKIPECVHGNSKQGYKCNELTRQDYSKFHRHFYSSSDKVTQDTFLLKYCTARTPKKEGKRKSQTICYFIPKYVENSNGKRRIVLQKVCQKAFTTILGVSKDRIQRICKSHLTKMELPKERRGGDRRSFRYSSHFESVKAYIRGLKSVESHYVRGKSTVQYLCSNLNIKKLHDLYCNDPENIPVKYEFFRRIFNKYFNLSFKTPATDACSKCIQLKESITRERDQAKKQLLIAHSRIHKLKAKWFYTSLKSPQENEIMMSFDCQKNLVLPKVPDQSAYFSRQLYAYNLTICVGPSNAPQTTSNTFIYTWLETEALKGSNQIASALFYRLMNTTFENVNHIKLFCDGCGGQNKNSIVLGMLAYWLKTQAPNNIIKITVIFPIVGHSFLPPDRIFGNIERTTRPMDVIVEPETYFDIFQKYGTVLRLGRDFNFYDWKSSTKNVLKLPGSWHFQFNASKRFFLRKDKTGKIAVKGEPNYVSELINYGNICKRGKSFEQIAPALINVGVPVKTAKLNDVRNLLIKHFGEDWATVDSLKYYRFLQEEQIEQTLEETDNEETLMADESEIRV